MRARSLFIACRSRVSIKFAPRTRAHSRPLGAGWLASGLSLGPGPSANSRQVDLSRFRLYGLNRPKAIELDVGAHSGRFDLGQRQSEHGKSLAAEETIWIRQRFSSSLSFCSCSAAAAGMAEDAGSRLLRRNLGPRSGFRDDLFGP